MISFLHRCVTTDTLPVACLHIGFIAEVRNLWLNCNLLTDVTESLHQATFNHPKLGTRLRI